MALWNCATIGAVQARRRALMKPLTIGSTVSVMRKVTSASAQSSTGIAQELVLQRSSPAGHAPQIYMQDGRRSIAELRAGEAGSGYLLITPRRPSPAPSACASGCCGPSPAASPLPGDVPGCACSADADQHPLELAAAPHRAAARLPFIAWRSAQLASALAQSASAEPSCAPRRIDFRRQILDADFAARRQHRHPPAQIHQLAHVAGPAVGAQPRLGIRRQHLRLDTELVRRHVHIVTEQRRNVLGPRAQRRQLDPDHVEAVIQVLAEQPALSPDPADSGGSRQSRAHPPGSASARRRDRTPLPPARAATASAAAWTCRRSHPETACRRPTARSARGAASRRR